VNNSSIGLYPRIVRDRDRQQRLGRGKWFAALWAAFKAVRFSHFLRVSLLIDGKEIRRKTPFVFIGNNDYEMDIYNIGRRPELDQGKLCVYFLRRGSRWGVILMLLKTLLGNIKQWEDFEEIQTDEITIISRKKRLPVAFDGEVKVMATPLRYKIHPRALTVIVPRAGTVV
jgi:diacylglycerol kinase family enzyme